MLSHLQQAGTCSSGDPEMAREAWRGMPPCPQPTRISPLLPKPHVLYVMGPLS